MRITTDQGEQWVPLERSDDVMTYDVIVDQAPWAPNLKEEVWNSLVQLVPSFAKMGFPIPPALLDYSPLPTTIANAWKQQIGDPIPPEVKQQLQQLQEQVQKLGMENMMLKAGHDIKTAQVQSKHTLGEQKNMVAAQEAKNMADANMVALFKAFQDAAAKGDKNIVDLLKVMKEDGDSSEVS